MDINELMEKMLSRDSIKKISQRTGTTQTDVKKVLASALPSLLTGAEQQANDTSTVEGFAGALENHSKADASDVVAFLNNVDMEDGGKIVGHLLGSGRDDTTKKAAAASGLNATRAGSILSVAAPLLMTLLGQQTSQAQQQSNVLPLSQTQQQSNLLSLSQTQQQSPLQSIFQPQQTTQNPSLLSGLMGSLLSNVDLGSLMLKLLGIK